MLTGPGRRRRGGAGLKPAATAKSMAANRSSPVAVRYLDGREPRPATLIRRAPGMLSQSRLGPAPAIGGGTGAIGGADGGWEAIDALRSAGF